MLSNKTKSVDVSCNIKYVYYDRFLLRPMRTQYSAQNDATRELWCKGRPAASAPLVGRPAPRPILKRHNTGLFIYPQSIDEANSTPVIAAVVHVYRLPVAILSVHRCVRLKRTNRSDEDGTSTRLRPMFSSHRQHGQDPASTTTRAYMIPTK